MKLVLDSNVIVAAFASRGLCNAIFEICIEKYSILISTQIMNEVSKALKKKLKMHDNDILLITGYLKEFCEVSDYDKIGESISRDKDDDGIISLALCNGAEYIITGDKDLLEVKKYRSVKIITPRNFWEIVKKDRSI